jgi:soluble lytic murein transglycosylase-like protein
MLVALRQDAFAAADRDRTSATRLQASAALGGVGDWPIAMVLARSVEEPYERRAQVQRDAHYLPTAYPPLFVDQFARIGGAHAVPPELLYAVARVESFFYPAALSPQGALGLFQFTRSTFDNLERKWHVLARSGQPSAEAFLLDVDASVDLGARWFHDDLLPSVGNDLLFALAAHNAGATAALDWKSTVAAAHRGGDVEYSIEAMRAAQTRNFVRWVLTDMMIVRSARLFDNEASREQ